MDQKFLDKINDFAEKLGSVSSENHWKNYFGYLKREKDNYIYEFYCSMRILSDLKQNYNIELQNAGSKIKFPAKPASKSGGWSYFLIKEKNSGNRLFQMCLGTEISLSYASGTTVAPDISIQVPDAGNTPDEKSVLLVMDAKYSTKPDSSLSISPIREFAQIVNDLEVQDAAKIDMFFHELAGLKGNCLITNKKGNSKHSVYCEKRCIKQVSKFLEDVQFEIVG